jgi:hypothetical protein
MALPLMLLPCCKEDQPRPKESESSAGNRGDFDPFTDTLFLDSLLNRLDLLQNAVAAAPSKNETMRQLIASALDSVADCLYIVGRVADTPDSIEAVQPSIRKRAAKTEVEKWALLVKSWITGTEIRYGTPIQGKVLYSKELLEKRKGDTLRVLFMIPEGSVVVR